MINKLVSLASIGGTFANVSLVQRTLSKLSDIVMLTVLSSMMVGMLIACAFYGLYAGLTAYGIEPVNAVIAVAALAVGVIITLGTLAWVRLQQIRKMPYNTLKSDIPGFTKAGGVISAFMEGLSAGRTRT